MDSLSNSVQGSKVPAGEWISALASDAIMHVSVQSRELKVDWSATVDTDFQIAGTIAEKGAGVYGGKLNLASGDADPQMVDATLRFDVHGQTLTLDLPAMWEDTVMFRRAPEAPSGCAAAGELVVEKTEIFKTYAQMVEPLGIMNDTDDAISQTQDYQLYETRDEQIVTLARLRVDFDAKQVMRYDPISNEYSPIEGSAAYFEGVSCK